MFQHDLCCTPVIAATPRVPDAWTYPFNSNQFDDQVNAIATVGNNIYVGGNFHVAGGVGANYIAQWNGANWSPLGSGLNGPVNAITVSGGNVYVGGKFTAAGGVSANYVASWDGTQWHALGTGMDDEVAAFVVGTNYLYAGGAFMTAGGTAAKQCRGLGRHKLVGVEWRRRRPVCVPCLKQQ